MSIDQAILESTAETGQITLRFYRWTPATLSLGYFQKRSDREEHLASLTCPIVRRSSGGGAIVHDDELTYSLCLPTSGPIARANSDLYDTVHHAIRNSLAGQSIEVSLFEASDADDGTAPKATPADPFLCFQRRAVGDLICKKIKVGGSAQRRLKNVLIQHGSLLLSRSEFAPELPGLKELTGITVDVDLLIENVTQQLASFLETTFEPRPLSRHEHQLAEQIENKTFGSDAWLNKR